MKTKLINTVLFLLAINITTYSQDFTFKLFLSDAVGNQDSLTLGYDPGASYGLDTQFNEMNISAEPFDSVFEARAAAYNYYMSPGCDYWRAPVWDIETKTFITYYDCDLGEGLWQESSSIAVLVKARHLPVTVSWDSNLFAEDCRDQSLIANWTPGGWFDACCCFGDGSLNSLNINSSYVFDSTDVIAIKGNDTLFAFFIPIADEIILNTESIDPDYSVKVFPNPSNGVVNFNLPELESTDLSLDLFIYDQTGKILLTKKLDQNKNIDLSSYPRGVYFYEITQDQLSIQQGKLVMTD